MITQNEPILQVAAKAAIVDAQGRVLLVREAATGANNTKVGYWGLVGGRLEAGESFKQGLRREVNEEVGIEIEVIKPVYVGEWYPVIHGKQHHIIAIFMLATYKGGGIAVSAEHDRSAWVLPADRAQYNMMEPDCYVVDSLA